MTLLSRGWQQNFRLSSLKGLRIIIQHDVLRHCFLLFFWWSLKGLQLFLRFEVSQKRPEARACWSQSSNSSSSSSIISASNSQGNLLELDLWVFSRPTMFTWKLGRWVLGLHAMPWMEYSFSWAHNVWYTTIDSNLSFWYLSIIFSKITQTLSHSSFLLRQTLPDESFLSFYFDFIVIRLITCT